MKYLAQVSKLNESISNSGDPVTNQFKNTGAIFSKFLPIILVAAGLALLVMLITGGIGLMTSAGNPDKIKQSYGRITNALIGFLIIFISYALVQLVEIILGVNIL